MFESIAQFWPGLAMLISAGVTYFITKRKLGDDVSLLAGQIDDIGDELHDFQEALTDAFEPDDDGNVVLTVEETDRIKEELEDVINAIFNL